MPPDDGRVDAGFFARGCKNVDFWLADSRRFEADGVDFCFIDGDHSQEGVWYDSLRAWQNRTRDGRWVIAWHDYRDTEEMAGLRAAIHNFSVFVRKRVYRFADSSTVFMLSEDWKTSED